MKATVREGVRPHRYSKEGDAVSHFFSTAWSMMVMMLQIGIGTLAGLVVALAPVWVALPVALAHIAAAVWCLKDFKRYPHHTNTVVTLSPALAYVGAVALATTLFVHFDLLTYLK